MRLRLLLPALIWAAGAAAAEEPLGEDELAARRQALEIWAFEPIALEKGIFRLHLDRRDASFFVEDYQTRSRFFSSWGRRGFASVRLEGGAERPIDRVEALSVEEERIRFRGASSAGELPPLRFELELVPGLNAVALRFEVPEERRREVEAVRLLDGALWVADADGGGMALPRGMGEWRSAAGEPLEVVLDGLPPFVPAAGGEFPEGAYSLPFAAIHKGEAVLLAAWDEPGWRLRVSRRRIDDGGFPGRGGLFLTLETSAARGELTLAPLGKPQMDLLQIAGSYRSLAARRLRVESLRFKTGFRPELRGIIGAALFRPRLSAPPAPPAAAGEVRYTFDEVARIAEHWSRSLEIDRAAFILDGWLGSGAGRSASPWAAAEECGGDPGLRDCAERLKALGFIIGLAAGRDQLVPPGRGGADGALAWKAALDAARDEESLIELHDRGAPHLLVVRDPPGEAAADRGALIASRAEFARRASELFGLWGSAPGSELDLEAGGYVEGLLSAKVRRPTSPEVHPLFLAVYGTAARIATRLGDELEPDDAAGFLAHLIYGEVPAYALPPHLYFEEPPGKPGEGPEWCFARPGGWCAARGLGPRDTFVKNTYEVASQVARLRAREPLRSHGALAAGGAVQESWFGDDLRVVVNFGAEPYEDAETETLLPQYGFLVRHPSFHAFHALRANGIDYERPAFFTVLSLEGKMYLRAERTRLYRGFGPEEIQLGGRRFTVKDEAVVRIQ
jgi:hypothetical protein